MILWADNGRIGDTRPPALCVVGCNRQELTDAATALMPDGLTRHFWETTHAYRKPADYHERLISTLPCNADLRGDFVDVLRGAECSPIIYGDYCIVLLLSFQ